METVLERIFVKCAIRDKLIVLLNILMNHITSLEFKLINRTFSVLFFLNLFFSLNAQDLDPRAYVHIPVKTNAVIAGLAYMSGNIVTDPNLPIKNIDASVLAPSMAYARAFSLLGLTAQALVAIPYTFADVSGEVGGQQRSVSLSGLADLRLRLSVLLLGAPAGNIEKIRSSPRKTILGLSINVNAPSGEFYSDKLINIGMNRWAFRPELAVSQPFGKKWTLDFYTGVWLFTDNTTFYPGNSTRTQDPMLSLQGHLSYNFKPMLWLAFNATYYVGGASQVNNLYNDDRQANARIGLTATIPASRHSTFKLALSRGAIVRIGQNFTTYSLAYQFTWIDKNKSKEIPKTD